MLGGFVPTTQPQLCFGKLLPQAPLSHLHIPSTAWGPSQPPHQGCSSKRCQQLLLEGCPACSEAPRGVTSILNSTGWG